MENMKNNSQGPVNLGHVNPEVIKKSSKKVDKKGSMKFSWKTVVIFVVAVAGVVVAAWKGIPYVTGNLMVPEVPYSVTDTLAANSQATFLDEVLAQKEVAEGELSLLEQVVQLEVYLDMSGKLDDLKLTSYTDTVIEIEETENFNKELEEKYQEFLALKESTNKEVLSEDSLRLYTLAAELNGYKAIVDSKITTEGYDILAQYGILVAKTAVIDASGISYTNIGNLTIPSEPSEHSSYVIEYKDPTTGKVFTIKIPGSSIIHDVMYNVYRAQTKDTTNLSSEEIISDLSKYLNDAKVAAFMRYENDGTLRTTNDYNDVREIIEAPKTK